MGLLKKGLRCGCAQFSASTAPVPLSLGFLNSNPCLHFKIVVCPFDVLRVKSVYLPMQKLLKITPSKSSEVNSPVMVLSCSCASRNSSANKSNF